MHLSRGVIAGGHSENYQDDRMGSHAVAGAPGGCFTPGLSVHHLSFPTQHVGYRGFPQQVIKPHMSEEEMKNETATLKPEERPFLPLTILPE